VFGPAGVLCVAFVILQFYNGAYKRMGHEAHKTPLLGKTAYLRIGCAVLSLPNARCILVRGCGLPELHHSASRPHVFQLSTVLFNAYTSISTADPENGTFGNPIVESSVGAAQVVGSPMRPKVDAALVRVTSLDSGGSGNGSNGVVIGELSGAHSSINMWHVRPASIIVPPGCYNSNASM
jgi:hypothetical protein